jgi:tRNA-Thr(GGU) m(6)t(6)A37 methyltransferase TsaA
MAFQLEPVAYVRGGRTDVRDDFWGGARTVIELARGVPAESLDGIDEFSHAEILFVFDRLPGEPVTAQSASSASRHPRGNASWPRVGIFAQRGKARPNRLGATIVRILRREGSRLHVEGLDAIDGTPVVDIKPVFAEFLPREAVRQPAWSHELMRDYWSPPPRGDAPTP